MPARAQGLTIDGNQGAFVKVLAMERAAGQADGAAIDKLLGAARLRFRAALSELRAL